MPGQTPLLLLTLAIPALYAACWAWLRLRPGTERKTAATLSAAGAGLAFICALGLAAITAFQGPCTLPLVEFGSWSPAFRLDAVSLPILVLVTFVGFVVVRFSRNYLDGDPRQTLFFARLSAALSATAALVLSGDLIVFAFAWVSVSLAVHGLLVFYPERPLAILAARKKFIAARLGDLFLLIGFGLLWSAAGTTDIGKIGEAAMAGMLGSSGIAAAVLIGLAALMKSAQWPFHGWITEVMETPTPVSALLHAGIVNAGGFAILRFSYLIAESQAALALLAMVGGGTALFASIVMLTQPRLKTQLAWSTIAQMGFMLLQCGLGAFSSALLHILAHSLYKAHAFLWAGSAVQTSAAPAAAVQRTPVSLAFASLGIALLIFVAVGASFAGALWDKPALAVLGSVIVLGMGQTIASGFSAGGKTALMVRICAAMVAVSVIYFALQVALAWLMADSVHAAPQPSALMLAIMGLTLLSFAALSVMQAMGHHRDPPQWLRALYAHASNGFYVNTAFNRLAGAFRPATART